MSEKKNSIPKVNRANKLHNKKFDYSLVEFKSIREKVKILCSKHGMFEQEPFSHYYSGNGCPACNTSNGEISINTLPKRYVTNYRLPRKNDDFKNILEYFRNKPFKVKLIAKPNCFENNCHANVDNYVNMYGGEKIKGYYLIYDIDSNRFIAIHHSIWKNTYGDIIDITRFSDGREWNLFIESNLTETSIEF